MIRKSPITMIMTTPVITLKTNDSLEKAAHLFKKHHIRHIPVVEKNKIVGMLSQTDILRLSFADYSVDLQENADALVYQMFRVKQIMKSNVVTVTTSNSVKEVAEKLAIEEFHAIPVVEQSKLVGIVTTTDLIKFLLKQF